MLFTRLYDERLAQASYLIGCGASGTAVVVDPNRLVGQYLETAARLGLRIVAVTETHIHADFVSGTRELAARTGATMYLSAAGPPEWRYRFENEPGVTGLGDGDLFRVGQVEFRAVHTPGHTPEHLSFLVTDTATAHEPMGILTGDFVFVGDVGRPDLLEKAAQKAGTAEAGAHQLFRSLEWFRTLPDHLQVWPGHGAGSACGKGMSAVPQSTVGYERRFNWALGDADRDLFTRQVLAGQTEPPGYFGRMKRVNRDGPDILGPVAPPARLPDERLGPLLEAGALVVDTRPAGAFAAGHLPGTLSIPFNKSFPTWAGSLLPPDRDLFLLVDGSRPGLPAEIAESLLTIGLDRASGWFGPEVLQRWASEGRPIERMERMTVSELAEQRNDHLILDVRGRAEWAGGHVAGATLIPLAELPDRLAEVPKDRPIAVHCQGGGRSAIAASLLQSRGFRSVADVTGGFGAWAGAGLPVEVHKPS